MILSLLNVMAGIGWDPEIRGALTVLVGSVVLFGSVWLILATNIGSRVATLNSLAGFFAWMIIMGAVWWIYGANVLVGDSPTWEPKEIVFGELAGAVTNDVDDLGAATLANAPDLVNDFCPGLVDATVDLQRARVVEDNLDLVLDQFYTAPEGREYCQNEQIGELLAVDAETIADDLRASNEALGSDDPRFLAEADLEAAIATEIDDEIRKVNQLTLSTLFAGAEPLFDDAAEAGVIDLNDWRVVSSAEAGEAQATASAFLLDEEASPFDSAADFIVLDTFDKGGKPERASDGVWDRFSNEIRNTVVFWHPTRTTVVQVAPTIEKEQLAGQAPPFPEVDAEGQVVSVVMVRDLGSRRLPAALITIGSLVLFVIFSWMLHVRDLELRRRTAEWDPAAA